MNKDKQYLEFASKLSFFEFTQKEFYPAKFKIQEYEEEIKILNKSKELSEQKLAEIIKKHPKSFDIFEQIFQMFRFSNVQSINFLFNIEILNSGDEDQLFKYLKETLNKDSFFKELYEIKLKRNNIEITNNYLNEDKTFLIKIFKETIVLFIDAATKKKELIYVRLKNNEDVCLRFSKYILHNLELNKMLESINLDFYLKNKRIPKDNKSMHGKFGTNKISELLINHHFLNINDDLKKLNINTFSTDLSKIKELEKYKNKWIFASEKYIESIKKTKQNKLKKFDFILLYDLKIKYAIETNFYSTSGSKIGINEEEYIDLKNEINEKLPDINFIWVTDGNYWFTKDGEDRFKRDLDYFKEDIKNYALLNELISKLNNSK